MTTEMLNIDEISKLIDPSQSEKPVLTERLADYKIDADLLKSKQFRNEISRFTYATRTQIVLFLEEFDVTEQHIVERYYTLKEDKMEAILRYLIEDKCASVTVKELVERLWDIEFKVISIAIKDNENEILDELDEIKKRNVEQESNEKLLIESIDNKMDVKLNLELNLKTKQYTLQQKPFFVGTHHEHFDTSMLYYTNNEVPRARELYEHNFLQRLQSTALISLNRSHLEQYRFKQNRQVYLLSVSKDLNNSEDYLRTKETFKQKLTDNNIRFSELSDLENIDSVFAKENGKLDPIFVLFDDKLNVLFDEKSNKNDACKYKIIGRRMYAEYIMNKCKNERFYTFLIDNNSTECKECKYKWLTNVYVNDKKQTSLYKLSIDENGRLNDDIDEFLIGFE